MDYDFLPEHFNKCGEVISKWSREKGFWDGQEAISNITARAEMDAIPESELKRLELAVQAEKIALMHSELGEALEAVRHGNPPDDKLPQFDGLTVELADAIIRILDFAGNYRLPIGEAISEKMKFNLQRAYKHGKSF